MKSTKTIASSWDPNKHLLTTQLSGEVDQADIAYWEQSLHDALGQIDDDSFFKIFINIHGFKAIDLEAHKRFRAIIPLTLAQYGWKVGYVDLFEEEARHISYTHTRGIQCVAAAHAHQDASKIERYEAEFSREAEHFFTNASEARAWIEGFIPG